MNLPSEKNSFAAAASPITEELQHEMAEAAAHLAEAARLIGQAEPALVAFFTAFTRHAAPEDLIHYTGAELAALARLVFRRTERRAPGACIIDIVSPAKEDPAFARAGSLLIVINDDMPFLYDSCTAEIRAQAFSVEAGFHPVVKTARDKTGLRITGGKHANESIIVLALKPPFDSASAERLKGGLSDAFRQVALAVRDWRPMLARLNETIAGLKSNPPPIDAEEFAETIAFLEWLGDNNFTFLGTRDYSFEANGEGKLEGSWDDGLGVLSDPDMRVVRRGPDRTSLTAELRAFLMQPSPLIITKSNVRSLVHRRVHMDYVGVKKFDRSGKLVGERRFVGLFTSLAYHRLPGDIPLLRRKAARVLARSGLTANSHDGKALAHILNVFPRDELFQIGEDELLATALGILNLGDKPKVRVFLRFDKFDRFVSAFVFVPRERMNAAIREKIHAILASAFDGRASAAYPFLDESALARVLYIVGRNLGERPEVDVRDLEAAIHAAIRTWEDGLADALVMDYGDSEGSRRAAAYSDAFPAAYRAAFEPAEAVRDLERIETLLAGHPAGASVLAHVYRKADDGAQTVRIKLFARDGFVPLSDCLPVFEHLGLKVIGEDSYEVRTESTAPVAIHNFRMVAPAAIARFERQKSLLADAFHAVWTQDAESDGFNRLVTVAEMAWHDVVILRMLAKYLRQTEFSLSQPYVEAALAKNSQAAGLLVALFRTQHDPDAFSDRAARDAQADSLKARLEAVLNDIPNADDDRIVRALFNIVCAMLRTTYFQTSDDGKAKPYVAFKLAAKNLDLLPAPRPLYEIFVYAPDIEGVHLRFGKVARGGIRWSDRKEDFRTEILSLVKAQQVKNAVIVPVGAKGGFFPKRLSAETPRDEAQKIGVAAYRTFIGALLDLTDNIKADGSVVRPHQTICYDDEDPYLVVAADKGTASFSDIANAIAAERDFWLGDAFASGGSHGYDHKKMGITARGAWEAVKRHFRELNRDIQSEPFSCIGVGDMSGDVFGNAMLLSRQTRLIAAFDHRHIFFDPDPDPAKSWAERKRLFDLPRSSWDDYDKSLISPGGGVFPRSAKEIALNAALRKSTGLTGNKARPADIMRALLRAEIDLLFFGGIGTYVKSSSQSNGDVGDKANDVLRVNGRELRAYVVGEGANLGVTQLGRVEYAIEGGPDKSGGSINTDAVDNSAGVDTSDHEVNIKILLSGPLRRGEISFEERNNILTAMTEEVAALVLKDNYSQTEALSVAELGSARDAEVAMRFMNEQEKKGNLDRDVEMLPSDDALKARVRNSRGLTKPELAVLLAYAKLDLFDEVIGSALPDDPYLRRGLAAYFPIKAATRFAGELAVHRLRREIITAQIVNTCVDMGGPFYVQRVRELSTSPNWCVARAFVLAEGAFGLEDLKRRIEALDGKTPSAIQNAMLARTSVLLRRLGQWFAVNLPQNAPLSPHVETYRAGARRLAEMTEKFVSPFEGEAIATETAQLKSAGAPMDLARDVASFSFVGAIPEIVLLAQTEGTDVETAAAAYATIGAELGLDRVRHYAAQATNEDYWDRLAMRRIIDDLYAVQRVLAAQALAQAKSANASARGENFGQAAALAWTKARAEPVARTRVLISDLETAGPASVAKLTLATSHFQKMATISDV